MEIILSKTCMSFTGSLGGALGYFVQKRGKRFFGVRNSNGSVPPDGHLKFILACLFLVQQKLFFDNILVPREEMVSALQEAGRTTPAYCISTNPETYPEMFTANDVLKLQKDFNL